MPSASHDVSGLGASKKTAATKVSTEQSLSAALAGEFGFQDRLTAVLASMQEPLGLLALQPLSNRYASAPREAAKIVKQLPFRCIATVYDGSLIVLAALNDITNYVEGNETAWQNEPSIAVVSQTISSASAIPHQYHLMLFCIEKAAGAGVYYAHDQALAFLVNEFSDADFVDSLLHPALRILSDYDEKNRSELYRTLKTYLENDCSPQKSAERLFLHRNSLIYRIGKIEKLVNIDLTSSQERSYLRLSFLLDS